jgi:hypothetical protein
MNKKVIALILSCVMLVSASPAVAAADTPVEPGTKRFCNHIQTLIKRGDSL